MSGNVMLYNVYNLTKTNPPHVSLNILQWLFPKPKAEEI